jgi:hypothetical protein
MSGCRAGPGSRTFVSVPMMVWTAPPERGQPMAEEMDPSLPMREGACPFCERTVLVYEEPPRCPLCACPMDEDRMHPFSFPVEDPAPDL